MIREVHPNLFVGDAAALAEIKLLDDYAADDWFIIHAAKEPWHRDALGYTERGAPPAHPEYLVAKRPGELMLNLVDMARISPQYTNPIMAAAFEAIDENLEAGKKVLIHCNEGKSRGPTVAMLWLAETHWGGAGAFSGLYFTEFCKLYPEYDPGKGMEDYARERLGLLKVETK